MTPVDFDNSNIGTLNNAITFETSTDLNGGLRYNVRVLYGDFQNNQIVSDPVGCISWRVFQIRNEASIDNTRINLDWPNAIYQFN